MRTEHAGQMSDREQRRQIKWMRLYMRTYWVIIGIHFAAQLAAYHFLEYDPGPQNFYTDILIYPTLFMIATVAIAHFIINGAPKYGFYALFAGGTLVSLVIIYLNMDIRIITAVMLLPIAASTVFFNMRLTLFTSALQIVAFLGLYQWDYWFRYYLSPFDLIATPIFLLMCTLVAGYIICSGRELVSDLQETMQAKHDLMVENTVMQQLTKTDALTGLYNHMSFHEFYEKALKYVSGAATFHLALIDIDNFKSINDNYGHRAGDLILTRVARTIREQSSAGDIPARYGGEEFALLLFDQTFEEAYDKMEHLRLTLSRMEHPEMDGQAVTVSIGLKSWTEADTRASLFEQVDRYLYAAKHSGKNKVVTPFHPA